jgi:RNA polymerase sigma-70 factor (ECF subfamily)
LSRCSHAAAPAIEETERYLRRAVRNRCFDVLRRRRRAPIDAGPLIEAAGVDCDPALRLAIEQAMRELPAEQREVIYLKAFERMTFEEIADATGESINTIASRHRYAMQKLRVRLRPEQGE